MSRLLTHVALIYLALLFIPIAASAQQAETTKAAFTPITLSLTAEPAVLSVCPGDPGEAIVHLGAKGNATVGNPVRYTWRASAGRIEGDGPSATWNLTGLKPGYYKAYLEIVNGSTNEECEAFSTTTVLLRCVPPVCPNVSIVCPDRLAIDEPITFSASMTGGSDNVSKKYVWSVSAGTIIEGQGTPSIKVDTKGLAGGTIKATFPVNGYPQDCSAVCLVQMPLPERTCRNFDEFPKIQRNDEKARLDNFAVELQNDPSLNAYVVIYPGAKDRMSEASDRSTRIVDYLVNTRKLDTQRMVTVIGETRAMSLVELWLCPQGVTPATRAR